MKKKCIILDIDSTLFYNDIIIKTAALNSIALPNYYDMRDWPEEIRKEVFQQFKNPKIMGSFEPFKNLNILNDLIKKGHFVYIVTSRTTETEAATRNMITKHFNIPYNHIYCIGSKSKGEFIKRVIIDKVLADEYYFVDDYVAHLVDIRKHTDKVEPILINNFFTPYNNKFEMYKFHDEFGHLYVSNNIKYALEWIDNKESVTREKVWIEPDPKYINSKLLQLI